VATVAISLMPPAVPTSESLSIESTAFTRPDHRMTAPRYLSSKTCFDSKLRAFPAKRSSPSLAASGPMSSWARAGVGRRSSRSFQPTTSASVGMRVSSSASRSRAALRSPAVASVSSSRSCSSSVSVRLRTAWRICLAMSASSPRSRAATTSAMRVWERCPEMAPAASRSLRTVDTITSRDLSKPCLSKKTRSSSNATPG